MIGVNIDPKTDALNLTKYYASPNVMWLFKRDLDVQTTPTVFTYKGKEYMTATGKECRIWLLDTSDFGGDDHQSATFRTPQFWISADMNRADPPVIANGIVFGYGSGEDTTQATGDTPVGVTPQPGKSRIENSTHSVLFALDGQTGKTLWSSGDQIASWNHYSGLIVANGRIYIGTYDGYEYCFGLGK